MKRLLLTLLSALALPTAVNAFPFGGDILVKGDIGEEFIIKSSSVKTQKYNKKKLIDLFNLDKKRLKKEISIIEIRIRKLENNITDLNE